MLWEVESQNFSPRDALLLRALDKGLYMAQPDWDLTDLERAPLLGR